MVKNQINKLQGEIMEEKNVQPTTWKQKKKSKAPLIIVLVLVLIGLGVGGYLGYRELSYQKATENMETGEYELAKDTFDNLDEYKSSLAYSKECQGEMYVNDKAYDDAIEVFNELGMDKRATQVRVMIAETHFSNAEYKEALAIYEELNYIDEAKNCTVQIAEGIYNDGDLKAAFSMLMKYTAMVIQWLDAVK